jgi:acetoin utilization deacetylase AcuC-like enzyme
MKIFFDARQSVKTNDSFSPSAQKPAQVVESWKKLDIPLEIESFTPLTKEGISLAHDPKYVDAVLSCLQSNGFGNTSEELAKAFPWVCGSMVAAAVHAFSQKKPAFSPTSGAHHAHYASGGNFCTFNFLVIAAMVVQKLGAKRIGIIDLDCHHGDGTLDIIEKLKLDFIQHYSFGEQNITRGKSAENWLSELPAELFKFEGCDFLIYNAGVDSHIDDQLGGILTTEQLKLRDHYVFSTAQRICPAIAVSLAGGYQRDDKDSISPVLRLHDQTLIECDEVFGWGSNPDSRK